jgi:hypothetical protein
LGWWTRSQRIRTAAELALTVDLVDAEAAPLYQRIAIKARQLRELGLGPVAIAAKLSTDRKTVAKALAWLARVRQVMESTAEDTY